MCVWPNRSYKESNLDPPYPATIVVSISVRNIIFKPKFLRELKSYVRSCIYKEHVRLYSKITPVSRLLSTYYARRFFIDSIGDKPSQVKNCNKIILWQSINLKNRNKNEKKNNCTVNWMTSYVRIFFSIGNRICHLLQCPYRSEVVKSCRHIYQSRYKAPVDPNTDLICIVFLLRWNNDVGTLRAWWACPDRSHKGVFTLDSCIAIFNGIYNT